MENKFKKNNIYFVVSTNEKYVSKNLITCNTEINGIWNENSIWLEAINKIKSMNNL